MASIRIALRFAIVLAMTTTILLTSVSLCRAEDSQLLTKESFWAPSGHPVQDTIGRGLDFVLRPAYIGASQAFFFVYKPPVKHHITTIRREETLAPEQQPQQPQAGQAEAQPPQAQQPPEEQPHPQQ